MLIRYYGGPMNWDTSYYESFHRGAVKAFIGLIKSTKHDHVYEEILRLSEAIRLLKLGQNEELQQTIAPNRDVGFPKKVMTFDQVTQQLTEREKTFLEAQITNPRECKFAFNVRLGSSIQWLRTKRTDYVRVVWESKEEIWVGCPFVFVIDPAGDVAVLIKSMKEIDKDELLPMSSRFQFDRNDIKQWHKISINSIQCRVLMVQHPQFPDVHFLDKFDPISGKAVVHNDFAE
jgi:hypothetical protein